MLPMIKVIMKNYTSKIDEILELSSLLIIMKLWEAQLFDFFKRYSVFPKLFHIG